VGIYGRRFRNGKGFRICIGRLGAVVPDSATPALCFAKNGASLVQVVSAEIKSKGSATRRGIGPHSRSKADSSGQLVILRPKYRSKTKAKVPEIGRCFCAKALDIGDLLCRRTEKTGIRNTKQELLLRKDTFDKVLGKLIQTKPVKRHSKQKSDK